MALYIIYRINRSAPTFTRSFFLNPHSKNMEEINQYFLISFSNAIRPILRDIAQQNCYGCQVDHPSQIQHSCVMMSVDEQLNLFYDEALKQVKQIVLSPVIIDCLSQNEDFKRKLKSLLCDA